MEKKIRRGSRSYTEEEYKEINANEKTQPPLVKLEPPKKKSTGKLKIEPLFDNVLIKVDQVEEISAGGLVIPESVIKEEQDEQERGTVVAVGPGRPAEKDGLKRPFIPMVVAEGDRVIFSKYGGSEVKVGDEELLLMSEQAILGIIKEE